MIRQHYGDTHTTRHCDFFGTFRIENGYPLNLHCFQRRIPIEIPIFHQVRVAPVTLAMFGVFVTVVLVVIVMFQTFRHHLLNHRHHHLFIHQTLVVFVENRSRQKGDSSKR